MSIRAIQSARGSLCKVGFRSARPQHRLRAGLLDVQLNETPRCPFRIQIYWSAGQPHRIDMEILASTIHAFENIEVLTWSAGTEKKSARSSECLIQAGDSGRWIELREALPAGVEWLVIPRDRSGTSCSRDGRFPDLEKSVIASPFRLPVVCYRPAGRNWSYVEMSHPDDCARIIACEHRGIIEWGFALFGLDIEKGVILRGRVRGTFIARKGDLRRAGKLLDEFAAQPPRLNV